MLLALVADSGFEAVDLGPFADDEALLTATLGRGGRSCDAIVTTGGVSVGDFDLMKLVLDRLGDMRWMQIAIRPAKPFAFGLVDGTPVFGLPGNPVSSMVSFELFARPALRQMMGHPHLDRPRVEAVADDDLRRQPDGKTHFVRVVATLRRDGGTTSRSAGGQGSHQLAAMAAANALAVLPGRRRRGCRRAADDHPAGRGARYGRPWRWPIRRRVEVCGSPWSTASGGCTATCASRSPTAATSAACTACPRRAWSGCPATSCSPSRRSSGSPGSGRALRVRHHPPHRRRADGAGPPAGARRASWPRLGVDLALTTNGATLGAAGPTTCAAAGLRRINISLDSLRRDRFVALTRRDGLAPGARRHRRRRRRPGSTR